VIFLLIHKKLLSGLDKSPLTEKVEALIYVQIAVFSSERRRPMGASTSATSTLSPWASVSVPETITTKSSAYLMIR